MWTLIDAYFSPAMRDKATPLSNTKNRETQQAETLRTARYIPWLALDSLESLVLETKVLEFPVVLQLPALGSSLFSKGANWDRSGGKSS